MDREELMGACSFAEIKGIKKIDEVIGARSLAEMMEWKMLKKMSRLRKSWRERGCGERN